MSPKTTFALLSFVALSGMVSGATEAEAALAREVRVVAEFPDMDIENCEKSLPATIARLKTLTGEDFVGYCTIYKDGDVAGPTLMVLIDGNWSKEDRLASHTEHTRESTTETYEWVPSERVMYDFSSGTLARRVVTEWVLKRQRVSRPLTRELCESTLAQALRGTPDPAPPAVPSAPAPAFMHPAPASFEGRTRGSRSIASPAPIPQAPGAALPRPQVPPGTAAAATGVVFAGACAKTANGDDIYTLTLNVLDGEAVRPPMPAP